jgi:hypothetical protein
MSSELQNGAATVHSHLKTLQEELAHAIAGFTQEKYSAHPPGKWCATEILEHLYLTYTGTTKGFSRLLAAEKPATTPPTWIQRRNVLIVLLFGYLPSGRQAPSFSQPRGLPIEKVIAEIAAKITEMDDMITRCEQTHGEGKLLDHAILGPLTAAQWRKFHLIHGRHHIKQIRKLEER